MGYREVNELLKTAGGLPAKSEGPRGGFKLTPDVYEKIIGLIQLGNYLGVAAQAVGITTATLSNYMRAGRSVNELLTHVYGEDHGYDQDSINPWPDQLHNNDWTCFKLLCSADRANAEGEAYAVGMLRKHMSSSPMAVLEYLARKHPDRWRRRDLHEVALQAANQARDDQGLLGETASGHITEALRAASQGELEAGELSNEEPDTETPPR